MVKREGEINQLKLVEVVSTEAKLNKSMAKRVVKIIIRSIMVNLKQDGKVSISGLGVFKIKNTNPRVGRNPKTGASVNVPAGRRISFRAGRKLKNFLK